jgi:hypothetical protein
MLGTVWTEYVVSFDGNVWTGPIYLAHSDNLLDNRSAVVATKPGELVVIGSSDGRGDYLAGLSNVLKERRAAARGAATEHGRRHGEPSRTRSG